MSPASSPDLDYIWFMEGSPPPESSDPQAAIAVGPEDVLLPVRVLVDLDAPVVGAAGLDERTDLGEAAAVILESDGSRSVITGSQLGNGSVLDDVPGWPRRDAD